MDRQGLRGRLPFLWSLAVTEGWPERLEKRLLINYNNRKIILYSEASMKIKNIFNLFLITVMVMAMVTIGFTQQGRGKGRIRGSVADAAGNPIPDVKIMVEHIQYGTKFQGKSDKKGDWAVAGLGTGNFRIKAEKEGYSLVYHEMRVSQFSRNNPPVNFTMKKVQDIGVPVIENETAIALFEEGNQLFDKEKYAEALAKYQEFLVQNPTVYQVTLNVGNCHRELREYEKAVEAFNIVLEKMKEEKGALEGHEDAARALSGIGETYIKSGELDKAVGYLQQALSIFPEDETLAFNIGEILFKKGEADKGIEFFEKAIKIKADWPPPYRQRGYAYLNMANYQMAVESFRKFIELAPDDPLTSTITALIPKLEEMIKK